MSWMPAGAARCRFVPPSVPGALGNAARVKRARRSRLHSRLVRGTSRRGDTGVHFLRIRGWRRAGTASGTWSVHFVQAFTLHILHNHEKGVILSFHGDQFDNIRVLEGRHYAWFLQKSLLILLMMRNF